MRGVLTLFATQLVLWTLLSQVNHALSDAHIYLFPGSLFVTYAALMFSLPSGLAVTLLAGAINDANSAADFGTHILLFAATHAVIFHLRPRLPREDTIGRVVIALLANLGLFLVFSFIQIGNSPAPGAAWGRLLVDLLCSQVFLAVIAPWFFALQHRALVLARIEREALDA